MDIRNVMKVRLINQCEQCKKLRFMDEPGVCPQCVTNNEIQDSIDLCDED